MDAYSASDHILNWIASKSNEFIYFAMLIALPSLLLNLAQIFTIIRHKKFHNSFYTFFIVRGIADILRISVSYVFYNFPALFGEFLLPIYSKAPKAFYGICGILGYSSYQANNLATAFLLMNRLSAIVWPIKYHIIWPKLLPILLAVLVLFPILTSYNLSKAEMILVPTRWGSNNQTIAFIPLEAPGGTYYQKMLNYILAFSVVFLILCFFLAIASYFVYKSKLGKNLTISMNEEASMTMKRKLLIYAGITFLGHCINVAFMIFLNICGNNADLLLNAINTQYPWLTEVSTMVLASWTLLWASDSFRAQFTKDFVPKYFRSSKKIDGNGNGPKCGPIKLTVSPAKVQSTKTFCHSGIK